MAYQITYGGDKGYEHSNTFHPARTAVLSIACGTLFLFVAYRCWPEGAEVMDRLLAYDGFGNAKEALEVMARELRSGTSLSDAVTAFCQEVISGSISVGA